MRYYMGRAYRENRRAMLAALERNKDRVETAMAEAVKTVEMAGREAGAELAAKRAAPAPGRIASKIKRPAPPNADSLVEAVTNALPGARFVGCVDVEPEKPRRKMPSPYVTPPPKLWYHRRPGQRDVLLTAGCKLEHFDPAELVLK